MNELKAGDRVQYPTLLNGEAILGTVQWVVNSQVYVCWDDGAKIIHPVDRLRKLEPEVLDGK